VRPQTLRRGRGFGAWKGKETLGRLSRQELDLQLSKQKVDLQLSGLKARVMEVSNEEVASSFQKAVTTLETAAETFEKLAASASAICLEAALLTVSVDRSTERLNHVKGLILRASEKRDQVIELLARRDVSPDMLDAQLAELRNDLRTVKNIFEDDKWGDDEPLREQKRIAAAIEGGYAQ
jgi:hypothetical protein